MKKVILTMMVAGLAITSCEKKANEVVTDKTDETVIADSNDESTISVSNDWIGSYEGTLPCADCEGINTSISLNEDGTYIEDSEYVGDADGKKINDKGTYTWDESEKVLTLVSDTDSMNKKMYKVEDGQIVLLDADGKMAEGETANMYILKKK